MDFMLAPKEKGSLKAAWWNIAINLLRKNSLMSPSYNHHPRGAFDCTSRLTAFGAAQDDRG
jgi:hypothetical protein